MLPKLAKQCAKEERLGDKHYKKGKETGNTKEIAKAKDHYARHEALKQMLSAPNITNKTTNFNFNNNKQTQNKILSNNNTNVKVNRKK